MSLNPNLPMIQILLQQEDSAADFGRVALERLRALWREHGSDRLGDW